MKQYFKRLLDVNTVLTRFPVPVLMMAILTIMVIPGSDLLGGRSESWIMVGLIIAGYVTTMMTIVREVRSIENQTSDNVFWINLIIQLVTASVIVYLAALSKRLGINLTMALGAVLLMLGNVIIWRRPRNDLHVWDFTHKLWSGAIFATVGSIIFALGVLSIQAALSVLFGLNLKVLAEHVIFPIGFGFLAPLYWLSTLPPVDEPYTDLNDNPGFVSKAVGFMGTWLLSPLILIYALILLAYGAKIILSGVLPKGEIAQLTTPFLIIGTLTWLILEPPFIRQKALAKLFRTLWFPLSIPVALLLAIAVGVRVQSYGFTPERLALIFCIVWALGIGLWFSLAKPAFRDIRIIPGFAAVLLGFGTFSSITLSDMNQYNRAKTALTAAGILSSDGIVKPVSELTLADEDAGQKAKGAIDYLLREKKEAYLAHLLGQSTDMPLLRRSKSEALWARLKLDTIATPGSNRQRKTTRYTNSTQNVITVAGFKQLHGPYGVNDSGKPDKTVAILTDNLTVTQTGLSLSFHSGDIEYATFDPLDWVKDVPVVNGYYQIDNPYIDVYSGETTQIRLVIKSASIDQNDDDKGYSTMEFSILTKGF